MHDTITRKHFARLVRQRLAGKPDNVSAGAIAFALDLFAKLALEQGSLNVAAYDLVGLAAGEADMRVIPIPAGPAMAHDRPGTHWRIQTLEVTGDSVESLANMVGRFFEAHVAPHTALVFDVRGQHDLTVHGIADVAGLIYQHAGPDNDVAFGAVGAPSGVERLELALVALIPID